MRNVLTVIWDNDLMNRYTNDGKKPKAFKIIKQRSKVFQYQYWKIYLWKVLIIVRTKKKKYKI